MEPLTATVIALDRRVTVTLTTSKPTARNEVVMEWDDQGKPSMEASVSGWADKGAEEDVRQWMVNTARSTGQALALDDGARLDEPVRYDNVDIATTGASAQAVEPVE